MEAEAFKRSLIATELKKNYKTSFGPEDPMPSLFDIRKLKS
jgi:hypothetical protein